MTAYAFQTDDDDFVVQAWRGKGPEIPNGTLLGSEAQAAQINGSAGMYIAGSNNSLRRWKLTGATSGTFGTLTEQTDTRPTGAFSVTQVDLNVGDAPVNVTLTLSVDFTGQRIVEFNGVRMRPTFTNGVATLRLSSTKAGERTYTSASDFRLTNSLRVRVMEDEELL